MIEDWVAKVIDRESGCAGPHTCGVLVRSRDVVLG